MNKAAIGIIMIVFCLLVNYPIGASAEESDRLGEVSKFLYEIEENNSFLNEKIENTDNDEAKTVFQEAENILHTVQAVLSTALQSENVELQLVQLDDVTYSLQTPTVQLDDADFFVAADVIYRPQFLLVRSSIYAEDNTYLGTTRVEIGTRDDTSIVLMVDYDNMLHMTGRFAVKIADTFDVIYTKTLGMNMDIVLNVSDWQAGEEIGTWDKQLLLPLQ